MDLSFENCAKSQTEGNAKHRDLLIGVDWFYDGGIIVWTQCKSLSVIIFLKVFCFRLPVVLQ